MVVSELGMASLICLATLFGVGESMTRLPSKALVCPRNSARIVRSLFRRCTIHALRVES